MLFKIQNENWVSETEHSLWYADGSSIVELTDGTLIASWYAGLQEDNTKSVPTSSGAGTTVMLREKPGKNSKIYLTRSEDADKGWSRAQIFISDSNYVNANPILFLDGNDLLWVIYNSNRNGGSLYFKQSADGGKTWTDDVLIDVPINATAVCKPVIQNNGTIVLGVTDKEGVLTYGRCKVLISDDRGNSWSVHGSIESDDVFLKDPTIVQLNDGSLMMYMRSQPWGVKERNIWESRSLDGGKTWSDPRPMHLPNNNSKIELMRLRNGNLLLALNPLNRLDWPWNCWLLTILISENEGKNWREAFMLEDGPLSPFYYPSLFQGADNKVHLTYTYLCEKIKYACLTIDPESRSIDWPMTRMSEPQEVSEEYKRTRAEHGIEE